MSQRKSWGYGEGDDGLDKHRQFKETEVLALAKKVEAEEEHDHAEVADGHVGSGVAHGAHD